ncbi:VOC family protein [Amycolatopsis regifaucium]|uniref:Glyoxalase n=1 Tax=Amycolatopsis regifaucium TaxID=546365 RepID=A0A154MQU6_9PSEU|nr:VOC family protein [Amycolatopsis regifaucium]KZB86682.1 glyoxalase [Amycolatopsis regifaucium]OKA03686.1 glyoxalase [Amycolatopsis regifaucium]SFJ21553.1 Catechol 2,3-dioxygenase [Amycolatopsis regifaucium]
MTLSIHASFLPADDLEASLSFYRDILGFEVREEDPGRVLVGAPGQPRTSIALQSPVADPELTEEERVTIAELMAKGTYATILLATRDLNATFDRIQATGADVVQEPIDQPHGVRDCAFRDPAGTLVRIEQR